SSRSFAAPDQSPESGARSTSHTPSGNSSIRSYARRIASRVFPTPPAPVIESSREDASTIAEQLSLQFERQTGADSALILPNHENSTPKGAVYVSSNFDSGPPQPTRELNRCVPNLITTRPSHVSHFRVVLITP